MSMINKFSKDTLIIDVDLLLSKKILFSNKKRNKVTSKLQSVAGLLRKRYVVHNYAEEKLRYLLNKYEIFIFNLSKKDRYKYISNIVEGLVEYNGNQISYANVSKLDLMWLKCYLGLDVFSDKEISFTDYLINADGVKEINNIITTKIDISRLH